MAPEAKITEKNKLKYNYYKAKYIYITNITYF